MEFCADLLHMVNQVHSDVYIFDGVALIKDLNICIDNL